MNGAKNDPKNKKCCCGIENEQVSPEKRCIGLLISVNREHKCMVENCVAKTGIHRSQHHMLMFLARPEKVPSQKEIAEWMGISPAAVAVTLKKLEKNGYIERCAAESDSRYNETRLSEKGRKVVEDTKHMFERLDSAVFADFSEDELRQCSELLKKIRENIRNCAYAVTEQGKDDQIETANE